MSMPWRTVLVAWLAAAALAAAQAPPGPSPGPGSPAPAPAAAPAAPAAQPAKPADPPAADGPVQLPPGFVPAMPYCAAPLPTNCPPPSPTITGIITGPFLPPQAWLRAEALLWWIRNQPDPQALLTTSASATIPAPGFFGAPGALNDPFSRTIIGQTPLNLGAFGGGRLTGGFWFDYQRCFGVEGSGFFLSQNSTSQRAATDQTTGLPFLARPFLDVASGMETAFSISVPGSPFSDMTVTATSRLAGGEVNFLNVISSSPEDLRMMFMLGGRYLNLQESMQITTNSALTSTTPGGAVSFLGMPLAAPETVSVVDQFRTQNQFMGGQVGFRVEWFGEKTYLKFQGEVALGAIQQTININGQSTLLDMPGGNVLAQAQGGFLALPSNIGQQSRTVFSVLPSLEAQFGYELIANFCYIDLGYSFLAVTRAVRPGLEIDRGLNPNNIPVIYGVPAIVPSGVQRPAVPFDTQTFWAHGLSLGLRFTY